MGPRFECDFTKMANAILFFVQSTPRRRMAKKKLWKLLYFADFQHYEEHGAPITGEMYVKYPYGPVPSHGDQALKRMGKEGLMATTMGHPSGYRRFYFAPRVACDTNAFSSSELASLQQAAAQWGSATGEQLEHITHAEAPWIAADDRGYLDYRLAVCRRPVGPEPEDEAVKLSQKLRELVENFD
jgi:uncharacterized phage-associated protein